MYFLIFLEVDFVAIFLEVQVLPAHFVYPPPPLLPLLLPSSVGSFEGVGELVVVCQFIHEPAKGKIENSHLITKKTAKKFF